MSCKKSSQRHGQAPKPPALWWEQLDDECPITLEPLSSLPYPPFQLGPSLFDGVALASYVVSRGMFENPLTREALTFSDCKKLDDYVKIYHKHDTRMAVCCEAFTLSQNVKVKQSSNDNGDRRARVLRSEAAAALCHLFVYRSRDAAVQPDQAAWSAQEQLNAFNLYSERPSDQQSAASAMMDGLRIIDDDEERIVQAQQSEWNEVQEAFPPLADNGASAPKPVSVDQHLLQTAKATAEQTRQQEYQQRLLLQQAHIRMIREAKARQEERKRARQAAKAVRQQHYEMERLEEDELERARAEIEQWRKEHWERLLQESTTIEEATKKSRSNVHEVEPPEDQTTNALDEAKRKEQERQEQEAKKKAKAAAKRRRAKERKKEQKELERKEAEKQQQAKLLQEKKAASSKKCDSCGQGYLGYGFEKFGHSFCSTKCARAGVPD